MATFETKLPTSSGDTAGTASPDGEKKTCLYERLGGRATLERVHRLFYDRVYEHPWMKRFFVNITQERIEKQQTDFMSKAMGGPNVYGGRAVPAAHEHMRITQELFDLRSQMLEESLIETGVSEEHRTEWLRIDGAFHKALLKESAKDCRPRYPGDEILDFARPPGV